MLTKNELKFLWKKEKFRPRKRLGQNFLVDKNIKAKILNNLDINSSDTVLEIGTGFGELTADLASMAKRVIAVEIDCRIARIFKNMFREYRNIILINDDFLNVILRNFVVDDSKIVIYGNLPYYITTPIIEKLFREILFIKNIYLVVQKEVAERITARQDSKKIGRLSLFVQYYTEPEILFAIRRGSFYPEPEVDSAFLKLRVLENRRVRVADEKLLFDIIKTAYAKRRKTILNALSNRKMPKEMVADCLKRAGINPSARAETLSLEDFARLLETLPALT